MSIKNSNDTIANRTRDFPTCSAVPKPTALLRVPLPPIVLFDNHIVNFAIVMRHGHMPKRTGGEHDKQYVETGEGSRIVFPSTHAIFFRVRIVASTKNCNECLKM